MIELKRSKDNVYYVQDYVGLRYRNRYPGYQIALFEKLEQYKKMDPSAIEYYTRQFMEAIAEISKELNTPRIGLVAVPPHDVERNDMTAVHESIRLIVQWSKDGIARDVYGCEKEICDCGSILERTKTIPPSHCWPRATIKEQLDSIACTEVPYDQREITYIILDDITTRGTSLSACASRLALSKVSLKSVRKLAIAKTIFEKERTYRTEVEIERSKKREKAFEDLLNSLSNYHTGEIRNTDRVHC